MKNTRIQKSNLSKCYQLRPSLAAYLPWCEYDADTQVFLLADYQTLGIVFQITPIPCEAASSERLAAIAQSLHDAIQNAIPCEKQHPWMLQFFIEKNHDLSEVLTSIQNKSQNPEEVFTKRHLETLQTHLNWITRSEGIFQDQLVTQQTFRGGRLQVYAVLYRRFVSEKSQSLDTYRSHALREIQRISDKLQGQWQQAGLKVDMLTEQDFYQWMFGWFNPKSQTHNHLNAQCSIMPTEKPYGWDFAEQLFSNAPESTEFGWLFNRMPHAVLTVQNLSSSPTIGHLTAERTRLTDGKVFMLFDHLPEGSIFSMTVVFQAQSEVALHLKTIQNSAVGRHALALKVKSEIDSAETAMAQGDALLPWVMAVYVKGESRAELETRIAQTEALLNGNGFKVISDAELYPADAYLRYLPMCYNFQLDKKYTHRSRYLLLSDIVKLLPLYGRSRGTKNPGMLMFNRGGEPWYYDILQDRTKNAHLLLLGETGTGKSNTLNFLILHNLALYNPRFFILDAGGSFELLARYCESLGKSVYHVKIDPNHPMPLNPFADGLKVLEQLSDSKNSQSAHSETQRDILGDMVLTALVMITGGEAKEEARIRRSDRMLVMDAIILAAKTIYATDRTQMIASDIVNALETLADQLNPLRDAHKIRRAKDMADSLRYFIQDPISSQFFNTPGDPWPTVDITVVDFGLFAQEGYEAQRAIAFCGVFHKIQALAEANQRSNRALISVLDENHIFSRVPLLAAMETRGAKMGRKLGWWLWIATQNLKDFADEARKMLAMVECWMCLALPPDEIDQIERFKPLTAEQRMLFLSARKAKGQYTEGVLLSPALQGLFRNIPPRLYLAMAATEQHEKHARQQLMQQQQISELEALHHIAKQMMQPSLLQDNSA